MASAVILVWPHRDDDTAHLSSCRYDHQAMGAVNALGCCEAKHAFANEEVDSKNLA